MEQNSAAQTELLDSILSLDIIKAGILFKCFNVWKNHIVECDVWHMGRYYLDADEYIWDLIKEKIRPSEYANPISEARFMSALIEERLKYTTGGYVEVDFQNFYARHEFGEHCCLSIGLSLIPYTEWEMFRPDAVKITDENVYLYLGLMRRFGEIRPLILEYVDALVFECKKHREAVNIMKEYITSSIRVHFGEECSIVSDFYEAEVEWPPQGLAFHIEYKDDSYMIGVSSTELSLDYEERIPEGEIVQILPIFMGTTYMLTRVALPHTDIPQAGNVL